MPTELPPRRVQPPRSNATGNLVTVAAVLLMLVLSYAMIRHDQDDAAASDPAQIQGL